MSVDDIQRVIDEPDMRMPSYDERANVWKRRQRDWLGVTYVDEGEDRVIVTVIVSRRGPQGVQQ